MILLKGLAVQCKGDIDLSPAVRLFFVEDYFTLNPSMVPHHSKIHMARIRIASFCRLLKMKLSQKRSSSLILTPSV